MPRRVKIIDDFKDISSFHKCGEHIDESGSCHVPVVQVACGDQHTIALSKTGEVWVWGTGPTQLGLIGVVWSHKPLKLPFFESKKVLAISCGSYHNAAIVQKSNASDPKCTWPSEPFCLKCQFDDNLRSNETTNVATCPLGLPMNRTTSLPLDVPVGGNVGDLPLGSDGNDVSSELCAAGERQSSADEHLAIDAWDVEHAAADVPSECFEEGSRLDDDQPSSSRHSSLMDTQLAEAFLSRQLELNDPRQEVKSIKETVQSATGQVVVELCNTVSEKFEMLVQMKATPAVQRLDDVEEFYDMTEEANATFEGFGDGLSLVPLRL